MMVLRVVTHNAPQIVRQDFILVIGSQITVPDTSLNSQTVDSNFGLP